MFPSLWLVDFAFTSPLLKHCLLLFAVSNYPLGILLPMFGVSTLLSLLVGCPSRTCSPWVSTGLLYLGFQCCNGTPVYGRCVSVLRYKDSLVHGWFWSILTVLHTIRLWPHITIFTVPILLSIFKSFGISTIKISQIKLSSLPIGLSI